MNILITAGGTSEKIDAVRAITNFSTGRLGSLIADCLTDADAATRLFYVCGEKAQRPKSPQAEILEISDTCALECVIRKLLAENEIHAVIHCMAVSDYRVKRVADKTGHSLVRTGKISSGEEALVLILEPVPKIISLFHALAPKALLVGFKLLKDASAEELLDTGYRLLRKNHCTFVFANDKREINGERHAGYLINRQKQAVRYESKREIAQGVASAVLDTLREGQSA